MDKNTQIELAHNFVEYTNKNIFLTGKAGTGKTTFLKRLGEKSLKRMIVVAPTGVAAINAGGVTIHSFFQMPFGPFLPRDILTQHIESTPYAAGYTKINKTKIDIIKSIDLLIIDEISMVRADLLDGIDEILRHYRDKNKPFGGIQLLMIGDIQQLSPIAKDEEWNLLKPYYESVYFFSSRALKKTDFITIKLKHIYRQTDRDFIDLLNYVRDNKIDQECLDQLNKRYLPDFIPKENEGYITLTTHNAKARKINEKKLLKLDVPSSKFTAVIKGDFPEYAYPTDLKLKLKTGAQVMFVKNDSSPDKRYYNGKIGRVEKINEKNRIIYVKSADENDLIEVQPEEWQNCKYDLHPETKEIEEKIVGSFTQFPLKLAWAITIHKSQGLTFEKAIIDAKASFAHGQVYVALSRCRSLKGMVLSSPLSANSIKNDSTVLDFTFQTERNPVDHIQLENSKQVYLKELVLDLFSFTTLLQAVYFCIKVTKDNAHALLGNLVEIFPGIYRSVKKDIEQVAENFRRQLHHLMAGNSDIETDTFIQKRICKGAVYFSEKIESQILSAINTIRIESDNKQVRKDIKKALDRLVHEATIKYTCLESCKHGFSIQTYLDSRAKAQIEKTGFKASKTSDEISLQDLPHPELFNMLREWRFSIAREKDLPAYMVAHQTMLVEICTHLPASLPELKTLRGIGRKKVEQYGKDILGVIYKYTREKGLNYSPDFITPVASRKSNQNKANTKEISLKLFRSGKSIDEIAQERSLTSNTIEGHMAYYIENGSLDIHHFMDKDLLTRISEVIEKNHTYSVKSVKEALGSSVSYGQIHMVLAYGKAMKAHDN